MVAWRAWTIGVGLCALCACDGNGDDVPPDTDPDPGPGAVRGLTAEQVRTAGVFWGSCVPDDGIANFIREVHEGGIDVSQLRLRTLVSCLSRQRNGCAAIEACTPIAIASDGPCDSTCDGDTYSACDDAWHFTFECGELGLACDASEGCVDPRARACDPEAFTAACESGAPITCSETGVLHGPGCEAWGLECGASPGGDEVVCRGGQGECEALSYGPLSIEIDGLGCDGDVLEACVGGGRAQLDCASIGTGLQCQRIAIADIDCASSGNVPGCDTNPPRDLFFCGRGSECVERRAVTCQGSSAVICDMGKLETVDCTELGFEGCAEPFGCVPNNFTPG